MKINNSANQLRRPFQTEITPGGFGCQAPTRPGLSGKWIVGDDGKLICEWNQTW